MNNDSSERLYVGYVVKRYPRFSETFIVNEILAHERAGMKLDIFALGNVNETHFQDAIAQVRSPVTRIDDKQHNTEKLWALIHEAWQTLPGFAQQLDLLRHGNVHELAQAILLALIVQQRRIQHLHAHFGTRATTVARLAAKFSGIGYSFTAHAKDIYFPYEEETALAQKLRDAEQTITVSDYNLDYLCKRYGEAGKILRIYNGVDLQKFSWSPPTADELPCIAILAVGRFVAKKGFAQLIDALRIVKLRRLIFHCTLTGDGPLRDELQQQIHHAGLETEVSLSGPQPQSAIIDAMRQATLVVAPCIVSDEGDRDGLPTVLLEAMALGTPVISTRVAGIPELVIDGQTGLCVPPEDPLALAEAIMQLSGDATLRKNVSTQARRLIEREFDIERNAARQRALFTAAVIKRDVPGVSR